LTARRQADIALARFRAFPLSWRKAFFTGAVRLFYHFSPLSGLPDGRYRLDFESELRWQGDPAKSLNSLSRQQPAQLAARSLSKWN
jgi:hypothetical protein